MAAWDAPRSSRTTAAIPVTLSIGLVLEGQEGRERGRGEGGGAGEEGEREGVSEGGRDNIKGMYNGLFQ